MPAPKKPQRSPKRKPEEGPIEEARYDEVTGEPLGDDEPGDLEMEFTKNLPTDDPPRRDAVDKQYVEAP